MKFIVKLLYLQINELVPGLQRSDTGSEPTTQSEPGQADPSDASNPSGRC